MNVQIGTITGHTRTYEIAAHAHVPGMGGAVVVAGVSQEAVTERVVVGVTKDSICHHWTSSFTIVAVVAWYAN